jgi:transcriptional regulator with XRE-family HTH domain
MNPGELLRIWRLGAGLSLREMAEILGISHQFCREIELGTRKFPPARVSRLPDGVREMIQTALSEQLKKEMAG